MSRGEGGLREVVENRAVVSHEACCAVSPLLTFFFRLNEASDVASSPGQPPSINPPMKAGQAILAPFMQGNCS